MKKLFTSLASLAVFILTPGCKSFGVIQLSPDTYLASKTSGGGIFTSMAALKAEVIAEANAFAESKGKVAIPLSSQETPVAPFRNPPFAYQFRVVDKNDPEAKRTSLVPRADIVVEKTEKISADVRTKEEKAPDLYTGLMKLEELRKNGVLTDEEFAVQKKRLLERQ